MAMLAYGGMMGSPGEAEPESTGDSETSDSDMVNLADEKASAHILDGDEDGGGHAYGTGRPGKSEFPSDWSRAKILHEISDVLTDPKSKVTHQGASTIVEGSREGINIRVVMRNGRLLTGYPTNTPKNP